MSDLPWYAIAAFGLLCFFWSVLLIGFLILLGMAFREDFDERA